MNILIAGGTGFVGQYLTRRYLQKHHTVTIVGRSLPHIKKVFGKTVQALDWNSLQEKSHSIIHNQALIINLAGAGIADQRWTTARRREILDSRIIPTQLLSRLCAELKEASPPLFNASAVGYYGIQTPIQEGLPPALDETTPAGNTSEFAPFIVKSWEAATESAKNARVRVVNMRFGVVLGEKGGMVQRLKLPFLLGLGGKMGSGRQPISWIALTDLARAIDFLLPLAIAGPVNIIAPGSVTQKQFAKTFAHVLKRPALIRIPAALLKVRYGQMAHELLLNGQHGYPTVLLENGFNFQYPALEKALKMAVGFDKHH